MVTKAKWSIRNSELVDSEGIRLCFLDVFTSEKMREYGMESNSTILIKGFYLSRCPMSYSSGP